MSTKWIECLAFGKQNVMHVRVDAITAIKVCEADSRYAYVFIQAVEAPLMVSCAELNKIPELPVLVKATRAKELD